MLTDKPLCNVYMLIQFGKRRCVGLTAQGCGIWQFRSILPGDNRGEYCKIVFPRHGNERLDCISVREGFVRVYLELVEHIDRTRVGGAIEYEGTLGVQE